MKLFSRTPKAGLDFLTIGDTVIDDFIRLKDARTNCNINDGTCEICMRFGDKIPFDSSTKVAGVGNSANAVVSAARLGLTSSILTNAGKDQYGQEILASFQKEGVDTTNVTLQEGKKTNYHYVLWFESERTILVKHETYAYSFPKHLPEIKTLYLSSLGEVPDAYYDAIANFAESRPHMRFVFQPGTFQMAMGTDRLKRIYARSDLFFCNKEEAARILGISGAPDIQALVAGLHRLGPKTVVITDGRAGAHASDGTALYFVPMYPDTREPFERTGAGDSFASTVSAALTLGKTLEEALLWGPINSMSVVQKIGGQEGLLPRKNLEEYLANAPESYKLQKVS